MTNPDRNAAIWFAEDGYSPESKGINGRRVAGASFLQGFLDHADVSEFVSLTTGRKQANVFAKLVADHLRDSPHRSVLQIAADKISPLGTVYFPALNYAEQLWMRQSVGAGAYSICGITHTTATKAVMRGMHDLRAGPQMEWDAVICTSRAVHAATLRNIEIADEALKARFGSIPPRPQLPIIPLGIDSARYAHDSAAASKLRKRMGWGTSGIVVSTLSRLLPYGKFDPAPLFIALQSAQEQIGQGKCLHFMACGIYGDDHSKAVFEECARVLMPDVSFTHLDGADVEARCETLSGSDIFTFPIDNVQETFGLAPIEAMAAGLPVVVSDWDGMRDTVTEDVGFRIPTRSVQAEASSPEARGYLTDSLSYAQYGARISAMTEIDVRLMTKAFVELARNDDLRRNMGKAALARARQYYDWSIIIPQMQDLWAELAAIRKRAAQDIPLANPTIPLPMDLFAAYPSRERKLANELFRAVNSHLTIAEIFAIRRIDALGRPFEKLNTIQQVLDRILAAGESGTSIAEIAAKKHWNTHTVERCILFLCKFGFVESYNEQQPWSCREVGGNLKVA